MTLADGNLTIKLADLTPCWLRENYLTGLSFVDKNNRAWPDSFFETHMQNALRRIEMLCDLTILPIDITGEQHDYRASDFLTYGYLQMFKVPVMMVRKVKANYPLGQSIAEYPDEWISIQPDSGQIHLVPARGSLGTTIIGQGGDWLPLLYGQISYVPNLWEVDYVAGMDKNNLPRNVVEALAKLACMDILTIASDLTRPIGVGSESVSLDGMSQSMSYQIPAFKARLDLYTADLYGPAGKQQSLAMTNGLLKQISDHYKPITMSAL